MKRIIIAMLLLFLSACVKEQHNPINAEIVIYGGTSGAVMSAVQASRMGKTVTLVCPDIHLGGLTSSGLGFTDTGDKSVIGGIAREFYQKLYNHYQKDEAWKWQRREDYGNKGQGTPAIDGENRTMWIFEPSVAEKVFEEFLKEESIKVYREHWLDRNGGVVVEDGIIKSI